MEGGIPDGRDGLTRVQRVVLLELDALTRERKGRAVPLAQLYGRVVEKVDMSVDELREILVALGAGPRVV